MKKQYSKQFKEDAVRYYLEHKEIGLAACAKNLGTSKTAISNWTKEATAQGGEVLTRGSGNYKTDEAKENAKLRKELRDSQDALEILKKSNQHSGKLTEALFIETSIMEDVVSEEGRRRLNVSGVLRILGVSRNGYFSFKKRLPSDRSKRKEAIKEKIKKIYDESYQNYGAPKITEKLQQSGECIAEKTVGNYMREMGIRAQYIKPYTVTTMDSSFSTELTNILNEEFNPAEPNAAWCSDITYIWTYEGFVYLTSIMDLYSRKIISWVLSTTLEAEYVVEAIEKAKKERNITKPLVIHSDRGDTIYLQLLPKSYGAICE